ncbi:MAG TPA: heavy metal translocating P-type ATPase [Acholeplasma sp.]|nr:heavy metal translocating P-type ATPase [Acholeplasma sp.]
MLLQRWILNQKKNIMYVSLVLIILAYINLFIFKIDTITEMILLISGLFSTLPIMIQAYQSVKVKIISIDVLVSIAVIGAILIKNYDEAAIVSFLFLFGAYLEQRTLNKTRSAIYDLIEMIPNTVIKISNNKTEDIDIDFVNIGDTLLVKTGSKVPVDGIVTHGEGYINEASITGESIPVVKRIGDIVYAGTILDNGTLHIETQKIGSDTTFGKIIELVEEAQDSKSKAERFMDKFSKYYTPFILILSIVTYIITKNIELSITILVLGCPGALVIGIPVSNVSGIGNGATNGVLFKGSETIKDFSNIDVMVFDKTGTLTIGRPKVTNVKFYTKYQNEMLLYLNAIEKASNHPLSQAIVEYINIDSTYDHIHVETIKGKGIIGTINDKTIYAGNLTLIKEANIQVSSDILADIETFEKEGHSIILVVYDNDIKALFGIRDEIRPNMENDLKQLKKSGIKSFVILSGDNQGSVNRVAKKLGIDHAIGNLLPSDKLKYIKTLQDKDKIVAYIGDGINDSPSLAQANIGISIGGGTDVAIETSDVVLIDAKFNKLTHAYKLSKKIIANMKQNILIALGVVTVLISGLFIGDWLSMSIGMFVHEASILIVILNGMRLVKFKVKSNR